MEIVTDARYIKGSMTPWRIKMCFYYENLQVYLEVFNSLLKIHFKFNTFEESMLNNPLIIKCM